MVRQPAVKGPQKGTAAPLVVLPGILPVQDDEGDRLVSGSCGGCLPSGGGQPSNEVVGGVVRRPARVGEPNQVRQRVIPESAGDPAATGPDDVWPVEPVGRADAPLPIPRECHPKG